MNAVVIEVKEECAVWGIVGTLIWGLIIALVFVITQLIVMVIFVALNYGGTAAADIESIVENIQYNGTYVSFATFSTLFLCGILIAGVVELKKNSCIKDYLGLKRISLKSLGLWMLVAVIFMILSDSLTLVLGKEVVPEFMSRIISSTDSLWFLWLALIIAAPIFEELFFRGFLLSGLSTSFIGPIGAVIVTSVLWAGIHLQYEIYLLLTIFVLGIILGIARLKTGSTFLTIGMHSFINLVASIQAALYLS
ncbi:MAG: lysostaphin resistance A-like protein [Candidatus Scalindua sp.]